LTSSKQEYCELVEKKHLQQKRRSRGVPVIDDGSELVSLKSCTCRLMFEPSVVKDYGNLVRAAVVGKIERIGRRLERDSKILIIRSAWRSFRHQRLLWNNRVERLQQEQPEIHPSEVRKMASYFIAPERKSMHATGGAVDALIFDEVNDVIMDFGANDGLKMNLGRRCYPEHPDVAPDAKRNRRLLIGLFEEEGFACDLTEFWHFDYGNAVWAVSQNEDHAIYGAIGRQ
jgi:D-alanyl-D-alanine dipeptidase